VSVLGWWLGQSDADTWDALHISEREARIENVGIDAAGRHAIFVDSRTNHLNDIELETATVGAGVYLTSNVRSSYFQEFTFQTPSCDPCWELETDTSGNVIDSVISYPDSDVQSFYHEAGGGVGNAINLEVREPKNSTGADIQLGRKDHARIRVAGAREAPVVDMAGIQGSGYFNIDGLATFTGDLLRISGSNNMAVAFLDDGDATVSGNENVLFANVNDGTINDTGTRNVINGRGTNDGDPNTTGDWSGHADFCLLTGAVIEDTTNSNLYYPKSDGTYSQIGS
jgi:hypothetical protein